MMKNLLLVLALVLVLSGACLAVTISESDASFIAEGDCYSVTVNYDGSICRFTVNNEDMLDNEVGYKYGGYFADDKGLNPVRNLRQYGNAIEGKSEKVKVRYEFGKKSFKCIVSNFSNEETYFFFITKNTNKSVRLSDNEYYITPIYRELIKSATFFCNENCFMANNFDKLWGPWNDRQVIDITLAPGETQTMTIEPRKITANEKIAIKELLSPADENFSDLNIYSPKKYQVFQRKAKYDGTIVISGSVNPSYDEVSCRIIGKSLKGKLDTKWIKVNINKETGAFSKNISICPGGWYNVEIKALKNGNVVATKTITNVGVGEVFVIAGQSNSTNYGQHQTQQKSGMVSAFNGKKWRIGNDPFWGPHDYVEGHLGTPDRGLHAGGGSFMTSFGDELYKTYKVPIGIATTGHGGTGIIQWQPDAPLDIIPDPQHGNLYSWMMRRINELGKGGFRMVLWHQGENDANMDTEQYVKLMNRVIKSSKKDAGWDFPWMVAKVSYHNKENQSWPKVRAAHQAIWDRGIALEGPDTDLLKSKYRDYDGYGIHFSPKGLKVHGKMWADCVSKYLNKVL